MISIAAQSSSLSLLRGTIEHFEASACKEVLKTCLDAYSGKSITLDVSKLESVSSVTLSFLLYGLRSAKLVPVDLTYSNIPPALFNMARVSGIESILTQSNAQSSKAN